MKGFAVSFGSFLVGVVFFAFMFVISYYVFNDNIENQSAITGQVVKSEASPYSSEVNLRRSEIEKIIRDSLIDAIREVEASGGYVLGYRDAYYPNKSVDFAGGLVPYYRVCGETNYPDFETSIELIKNRFLAILDNKLKRYANSDESISYSGILFDLNVLEDKAVVSGNVYVSYKGKEIPSDYYVSVPTRFKELYEYATNFAEMMAKYRLMDLYFLNTLLLAEEDYFPMKGMLIGCGNTIQKTKYDLTYAFMDLYSYFIDNVALNVDYDEETGIVYEETDPPFYVVPSVLDKESNEFKKYDIKAELYAPDDFFFLFPEGVRIVADEPVLKIVVPLGDCIRPYDINYTFPLSYVVSLKDDLLSDDAYFYFAEYSWFKDSAVDEECGYEDVENNTAVLIPGMEILGINIEAQLREELSDEEEEFECRKETFVSIEVLDENGNPIKDAYVSFGPCVLGKTGDNGRVGGWVNEGEYLLRIDAQGDYVDYLKEHEASELSSFKVSLPVVKDVEDIEIKYVVASASLVDTCNEDDEGLCTGYTPRGALLDVSAKNAVLGPLHAGLDLYKCEVLDNLDLDDEMKISVGLNLNEPVEERISIDDEIKYAGLTFGTDIDLEGKTSIASGIYYVRVVENIEYWVPGNDAPENTNLIGYYAFSSRDFNDFKPLEERRPDQLYPETLRYFNIPILKISSYPQEQSFIKYLGEKPGEALSSQPTGYLDFAYVSAAKYGTSGGYKDVINKFSREMAKFIYESCRIDPFDEISYDAIYPVRNDNAVYLAAKDCGVDANKYCSEDDEGNIACDLARISSAMESYGCKLVWVEG